MAHTLYKHVFLEYSEYQRLLELKDRNEELLQKIKALEMKLSEFERDQKGHGDGIQQKLEEKTYREKLQPPLVGLAESITLPPSASAPAAVSVKNSSEVKGSGSQYLKKKKWYFIGPPDYARK